MLDHQNAWILVRWILEIAQFHKNEVSLYFLNALN